MSDDRITHNEMILFQMIMDVASLAVEVKSMASMVNAKLPIEDKSFKDFDEKFIEFLNHAKRFGSPQ